MGSVDPPRRLSSKLSAALCLGINHTNPLTNLRPLLDNTNSPLQVIQAKASREQGRGDPAGSRAAGLRVRPRENTCAHGLRAPRPDVCSQRRAGSCPRRFSKRSELNGGRIEGRGSLPPQPCHWPNSPREDSSFSVLLVCKSCHPSAHTA